jgi:hypothetical protein
MNTTRRIHLNPQSKGNLGKSFEAEFRTAWLDKLGVPWNGSDLDDRLTLSPIGIVKRSVRISLATSRRAKLLC